MAQVKPFRGIRFNSHKVSDLSQVIAPPYDVISTAKNSELHERDPYNCIRLILGDPSLLSDSERQNPARYDSASQTLRKWLEDGVLTQDEKPSIYLLEESFDWRGENLRRFGFLATLKLEEFGKGQVLPHEKTLANPIEDRFRLMEATRMHTSPIYLTFEDGDGKVRSEMKTVMVNNPDNSFRNLEEKISYRLWQVDQKDWLDHFCQLLEEKPFLIADGHHRYTTALKYAKENGEKHPEANWMMIYAAPGPDDGLVLSAIHRIFDMSLAKEEFESEIQKLGKTEVRDANHSLFEQDAAPIAFMYPESKQMLCFTPHQDALSKIDEKLRSIPSVLLNDLIVKPILGIDLTKPADQKKVRYVKHADELLPTLRDRKGVGFWLKPMALSEVIRASEAGFVLPQKSTFFYPKVQSGITFHSLA